MDKARRVKRYAIVSPDRTTVLTIPSHFWNKALAAIQLYCTGGRRMMPWTALTVCNVPFKKRVTKRKKPLTFPDIQPKVWVDEFS